MAMAYHLSGTSGRMIEVPVMMRMEVPQKTSTWPTHQVRQAISTDQCFT